MQYWKLFAEISRNNKTAYGARYANGADGARTIHLATIPVSPPAAKPRYAFHGCGR